MSASQDYVALDWIKGEIGQTLKQAQQALEVVAESPEDLGSLRSCLTAIHQVHGTLQMVQLAGPTQVASEMEQLSQALMNNNVPDVGRAQEALMQAILQMPGYLDRIHREQQDLEANYLPIVNSLRVARGEQRIPGAAAASGPDLGAFVGPAQDSAVVAYGSGNGTVQLPRLRVRYQKALVAVLKRSNARENLTLIGKIFAMLTRLCGASPIGNASVLGLAIIEGVTGGAIKLDNSVAGLLKSFDKAMKHLIDRGAAGLSDGIDDELVLGMIRVIDSATKETPRIQAARALVASPGDDQGDDERGMGLGPDDETLSTVAAIIREELASVTDKLDLFVRSSDRNNEALLELLPLLVQISGTLTVVGLTDHQQSVEGQVQFLRTLDSGGESPDDEQLLDMARALLQIESSLASMAGEDEGGDGDSFGDLSDAQAAVIRETRNGLARCRDCIVEFVSSDFDHDKIETLGADLMALRGGLLMANQGRSGDVLISAARYAGQVVSQHSRPELSELDDLADAITSIDYYLERLIENANDPYLQMIEVAEAAVDKLGFPVGEEARLESGGSVTPAHDIEESQESDSATSTEDTDFETDGSDAEVEETEATAPESAEQAEHAEQVEQAEHIEQPEHIEQEDDDDLIDEEILEIFVEEAEEVLETINEFLPVWQANREDEGALTEVRRAYHTLKGSGRMVGATVVGELAWSVENALNRVIDGTISADDALMALVREVTDRVPEGIEYFQQRNQGAFQVDRLVQRAEALAEGRALSDDVDTAARARSDSPEVPMPEDVSDTQPASELSEVAGPPSTEPDVQVESGVETSVQDIESDNQESFALADIDDESRPPLESVEPPSESDDIQVQDLEVEDDDSFSLMDIEDDGQGPLESSDASPQVDDMQ
ncbi:MAG: Hpt domain-containing protein, partial [Proteobacteria bacterium]|nr:Hpt domain-containing protein [Pseudomonadota bacterium]